MAVPPGSVESEDPEDEDRIPKTPKHENEDPGKTRKRRPQNNSRKWIPKKTITTSLLKKRVPIFNTIEE